MFEWAGRQGFGIDEAQRAIRAFRSHVANLIRFFRWRCLWQLEVIFCAVRRRNEGDCSLACSKSRACGWTK